MDYGYAGLFTKMLVVFQIVGELNAANRNIRRNVGSKKIPVLPVCLKAEGNFKKKNSFLWNIHKTVTVPQVAAKQPMIIASGDDAFVRPKRRLESASSYFFGTIHVPYSQVWDFVSSSTKQAFEDADHVIFELDLTNRRTVAALTACQLLPTGQNLSEILPVDLFARLKGQLDYVEATLKRWTTPEQKRLGLYSEYLFSALTNNWQRKRPIWVLLMLNSLTESEIKSRGIPVLDLYLAQEATRLQKQTGAVERVEEQCQPLNDMDLAQVIFALDQSLQHHESLRRGTNSTGSGTASTDDLVFHYNCGDLDSVIFRKDSAQTSSAGWSAGMSELNNSADEYFRMELIQKRNRRMAKRVIELLETYPKRKFFFAFGAGHFLGNHSVIDYMAEMGYNITHLPANHQIKSRNPGRRRNRQRTTSFFQSDSAMDLSLLNRWGSTTANEHFLPLQDTDRILANLRSDYVDDRSYEHRGEHRRRKQQGRISSTAQDGRRLTTTMTPSWNFNELWIRQTSTARPPSHRTKPHGKMKEANVWKTDSSSAANLRADLVLLWILLQSCLFFGIGRVPVMV
ncbi:Metalloprotease TIKI1 [Hypsibius exemplaris]|uniref:Metalloprotease TIKI homolog n=1 Tax=Hypsibius exemplaris TaxID=2072580 RepID=A0A1W0WXB1_HYPEX|nr:Metalloprotease TIKI1 [Hypsibius exemplaris]